MGNSSSHQHCPTNLASQEMGRGWTQSFPRELTRHHSQPPGHKVLPEPPNQRLRATNNGNIIHNGGTISGRRPSALTLPHDLNKQEAYRSRSASTMAPRGRDHGNQHNCSGHYRPCNGNCRGAEMMEIKRFGSEPDLRYSPTEPRRQAETRHSGYYPERESRYRGKKKYKAPAPPTNGDGSSPDSYKWEIIGRERENMRQEDDPSVQPPPRRSRLFKTRAETKRQLSNWQSQTETNDSLLDSERRWRSGDKRGGKEDRSILREYQEQDRWSRDERKRAKKFDGKNTLQRSLSSPEFQAELMQVARKVRNKLGYNKRVGPVGAATVTTTIEQRTDLRISKSMTSIVDSGRDNQGDRRNSRLSRGKNKSDEPLVNGRDEIRSSARLTGDKKFQERARSENGVIRSHQEVRLYDESRMDTQHAEVRENVGNRRRVREKSTTCGDKVIGNGCTDFNGGGKLLNGQCHGDRRNDRARMADAGCKNDREVGRTRSDSPGQRICRDRMDVRGQGSGRESTPEPPRGEDEKIGDNRRRRNNVNVDITGDCEKWTAGAKCEKYQVIACENNSSKETLEVVNKNWNVNNGLSTKDKQPVKKFYFDTEDDKVQTSTERKSNRIQKRLHEKEYTKTQNGVDEIKIQNEDIALKLRPTLPKKQLEIPRFSPSAAWRLLSALETPGPTMSTASEEMPVMYEERIERLSRPPPPLIALGPRSSHDKSGDSGISGDAGGPNEDSPNISTARLKAQASRPTWTPQQDLGEESSSDAGVDSPPPMPPSVKFPSRPHVFSLSLPRDDNRHTVYAVDKTKENGSFNSLQKIKKSVSGAFGLSSVDFERKRNDILDDNWLLSTSAPTSLQHSQVNHIGSGRENGGNSPGWDTNFAVVNFDEEPVEEDKPDFPVVMKPPSFSYLASGGHVMYLPSSNGTDQRTQSLNYRNSLGDVGVKNNSKNLKPKGPNGLSSAPSGGAITDRFKENGNLQRERSFINLGTKERTSMNFSKSCENISEMKQRSCSPSNEPENLQDKRNDLSNLKLAIKPNPKGKRFTFQSTVRQIERRRLAEKLSREAEAKERQRKSELEAMRKVEEEFQRKRAKEKANIRQQLRLYSMDENASLPPVWDSHVSRADPDGAPSSSASSPTSAPPGKHTNNRKASVSSDEYHRKKECRIQQQSQTPREYKDYRPKYYDWAGSNESSSHLEIKQTTVHPKIVCDIPKSSHVFVDTNNHTGKPNSSSTPRSDNYRKDFAHGAVAARSSLASSDSELSQPNTRPHSRQNGNKTSKPVRTRDESSPKVNNDQETRSTTLARSTSPARSSEVASSEEEAPVEAIKQERNSITPATGFILNTVQPFVREKSYRPISFNPQPPPPPPPPVPS
ncbi:uncharacterized protein LOC135169693 isoform X3 [Diachasmimorpha longicaudata]|uniref:uncharacterized protein LOC135169693 isoform X3 n=1 Tax=Diachasmimorpha longicaudata TaxID=58733 RepID=UPI0030B909F3